MIALPEYLNLLNDNIEWFCDGTFFTAPKHFYQLYVIHVWFNQHSNVSVVYALLQKNTTKTYMEMLSNLIDICTKQNIVFSSKINIMIDFEIGMISALDKIFR